MGCGSSKGVDSPGGLPVMTVTAPPTKIIPMWTNKKSAVMLYQSEGPRSFPIDGDQFSYNLTYCVGSQRGYYPDSLHKANQDSFLVCEHLLAQENCFVFGIFDGHGTTGDECSYFCAQNVW